MREARIKGEIGDGVAVMTEWFEDPESSFLTGIEIGLEGRGWENLEREVRRE